MKEERNKLWRRKEGRKRAERVIKVREGLRFYEWDGDLSNPHSSLEKAKNWREQDLHRLTSTRKYCNCADCRNPRRFWKGTNKDKLTLQERRDLHNVKDQVNSFTEEDQ